MRQVLTEEMRGIKHILCLASAHNDVNMIVRNVPITAASENKATCKQTAAVFVFLKFIDAFAACSPVRYTNPAFEGNEFLRRHLKRLNLSAPVQSPVEWELIVPTVTPRQPMWPFRPPA